MQAGSVWNMLDSNLPDQAELTQAFVPLFQLLSGFGMYSPPLFMSQDSAQRTPSWRDLPDQHLTPSPAELIPTCIKAP